MVLEFNPNRQDEAEQFHAVKRARKNYEGSKQEEKDIDTVAFENERGEVTELEEEKSNKGHDGFIESAIEFVPDVLTGLGRATEQVSRSLGGPENIFNFEPPDDTASHVIQTFFQFAGPAALTITPVGRATATVAFLAKHKTIKRVLDSALAGLPVDAFAFAPEDGNAFNFLITALGVSEDSRTGAVIKEYLAVDPADTELKARAKNALTGIVGSVMFDMIIRIAGGTIKTGYRAAKNISKGKVQLLDTDVPHANKVFSGKTQTDGTAPSPSELQTPQIKDEVVPDEGKFSDEELKEVTDELGANFTDTLDRGQASLSPEEMSFVGSKFSNRESGDIRAADKEVADGAEFYHSSTPEAQTQMREVFEKVFNGEKLSDIELDSMNPFNLTKLNSPTERIQIIAQLGEIMKDTLPRNLSDAARAARRELLDEQIAKQIKFFGADPETFLKNLQKAAPTVEGQIQFLRAGKTFTDLQVQKALREVGKSIVKRTKEATSSATAHMLNAMNAARATSGLNTSFGRGLAELKNTADAGDLASQTNLIKAKMVNDIMVATPELGAKRDGILNNLESLSKLEREASPEDFGKVKKERTAQELAVSNTKRLEKQLADLKAGKTTIKNKREITLEEKRLKKEIKDIRKASPKKVRSDEELANANIKRIQQRIKNLKSGKTPTKSKRDLTELEESLRTEERALLAEKRITEILSADDLQARQRLRFMELSLKAKSRDILTEIYINGLLSSIKTSVVNFTGNSTATISSIFERAYAGATNDSIDGVTLGEAAQLTWSYVNSFGDFWRTFFYAAKNGPSTNAIKSDLITVHNQSISGAILGIGGNVGKAIDGVGWAVNLPGRMLLSMDEAFKMIHYRAQIDALSYRKARNILGDGASNSAIALKHSEIKNDVLNHKDILAEAKDFSELNTFTNKLPEIDHFDSKTNTTRQVDGLSRTFKKLLDRDPTGLMRTFIPFFQTPVNLLSYAGQRTPFIRKFSQKLQRELSGDLGLATKQLAEAKVATGNMMWATTMGMAMTGNYTGAPPVDYKLRIQQEEAMGGAFWYSRLTKDGWVPYNKFDPLGIMLAGSANMANLVRSIIDLTGQGNKDGYTAELMEAFNQTFADAVVGTARLVTDRHYLQGFGNLIDMLTGDPRGFSKGATNLATALDPTASFYSSFRRNRNKDLNPEKETPLKQAEQEITDPLTAGWNTMSVALNDSFENSQSLLFGGGQRPAARNHMGEVKFFPATAASDELNIGIWKSLADIRNEMGLGTASINPFAEAKKKNNPVMNKLASLGSTLSSPSQWEDVDGVKINQEEHTFYVDIYVELNQQQKLENWVLSKSFNNLPEAMQLDQLESRLQLNRNIAEIRTASKFSRLRDASTKNLLNNIREEFAENLPQRSQQSLFNLGN